MPVLGPGLSIWSAALSGRADQTVTRIRPGTATAVFAGQMPVITAPFDYIITPGTAAATFTGNTPTVIQGVQTLIEPGTASAIFIGRAPSISISVTTTIEPGTASATFAGTQPTISVTTNTVIEPGTAAAIFIGRDPTIVATANVTVAPGTASPTFAGQAPTATVGYAFSNADAAAYVGAMTVKPSDTDSAAYDAFFAGLATDSIVLGTDILGMHCLKCYTKQGAYLDMVDPTTSGKVLTENGTVTWTSYGGAAAAGGAGDNLDTGQAANTALTFTDASLFQKMRTQNTAARVGVIGYRGARGTINHGNSSVSVGYIHSSTTALTAANAADDQFIVLTRNGTDQQFYVNGSASGSVGTATDNTLNETNTIKYLGDGNASGTGTVDFAGYGAAMTPTKWANFHSRVATLLSTLGT